MCQFDGGLHYENLSKRDFRRYLTDKIICFIFIVYFVFHTRRCFTLFSRMEIIALRENHSQFIIFHFYNMVGVFGCKI